MGTNGKLDVTKLGCTPTQLKILTLLSDCKLHGKQEVHNCLWDTDPETTSVYMHLSNLRKLLRPVDYDIGCNQVNGTAYYQLIHTSSLPLPV